MRDSGASHGASCACGSRGPEALPCVEGLRRLTLEPTVECVMLLNISTTVLCFSTLVFFLGTRL